MHGKLFREWILFLKERKLYSRFIMEYVAANASTRTWKNQNPSFKLLNGGDYIIRDKSDSLEFLEFLFNIHTIEWYLPYTNWTDLANKFGELKGYVQKKDDSNYWSLSYDEEEKSMVYKPKPNHRHRRKKEEYGKWYDRFYGNTIKNRYRR
jgi:hypothetical protein